MNIKSESSFEWRDGTEAPIDNRAVRFEVMGDPIPKIGIFLQGLFAVAGQKDRVYRLNRVTYWNYLDARGSTEPASENRSRISGETHDTIGVAADSEAPPTAQ